MSRLTDAFRPCCEAPRQRRGRHASLPKCRSERGRSVTLGWRRRIFAVISAHRCRLLRSSGHRPSPEPRDRVEAGREHRRHAWSRAASVRAVARYRPVASSRCRRAYEAAGRRTPGKFSARFQIARSPRPCRLADRPGRCSPQKAITGARKTPLTRSRIFCSLDIRAVDTWVAAGVDRGRVARII